MRNLTKSWMLVAVLAVGAILNVGHQQAAKAFTLIEINFLPAVQLIADERADIKVTNVSVNSVTVRLTVYNDEGTVIAQLQHSIAAGTTFTHAVRAPSTGPLSFHAIVESDTAHATVSDAMAFDKSTGQVIAILPFIEFATP
jgi:acyl CoA:acetate/3-ketoacid CoA transferase